MKDILEKIKRDALSDPLYFTKLTAKSMEDGATLGTAFMPGEEPPGVLKICKCCSQYFRTKEWERVLCDDCGGIEGVLRAIGVMK